jgi:hypothetical protein
MRVHIDGEAEDLGAEDGEGVGGEEGDDDAGAGTDFDDEWDLTCSGGGEERVTKTRMQPFRLGRGGEGVEEEKGVFGWFVDEVVGHVGC